MRGIRQARVAAAIALLAAAGMAAQAGAATKKPKPKPKVVLGPNLVVNSGFELSDIEGNPAAAPGSQAQPLLPTGWRFEGMTVLFDHSQNVKHTGKRAAAISGSLSGGQQFCETGTCVNNPTNPVKDAAAPHYTLPPHWKTDAAIPVKAGKAYQLNFWAGWTIITVGQGIDATLRWVDGSGATVAQQSVLHTTDGGSQEWKKFTVTPVTAPAGATGVVVMLGQTDDLWTGQVMFDDVYFGTYALI
jgi:hypothetical protein